MSEPLTADKNYRTGDNVGPDYICVKCGLADHRLWRESNVFLNQIELSCATCAEAGQQEAIARYAEWHQPMDCGIGNLIPARPTPEGDTFWGHTSGDVEWWYRLPQYQDTERETKQLRLERDHFCRREQFALNDYLEAVAIIRARDAEIARLTECLETWERCQPGVEAHERSLK